MQKTKNKKMIAVVIILAIILIVAMQAGIMNTRAFANQIEEKTYCGVGGGSTYTETITYTNAPVTLEMTDYMAPNYDRMISLPNDCAPVAGAIIAGFYDYTYTNLIPNYTSVVFYNNRYYLNAQSTQVNATITSLYSSMQTNSTIGTTFNNFKNGFASYVQGQGYSISYTSVMSWGSFSLSSFISQVNNGKPVALFLQTFKYVESGKFTTSGNTDTLIVLQSTESHVCVAYGYKIVNYYNGSTNFRTDTYLMVSLGNDTYGYLNINDTSVIDEAIAVSIY